MARNSVWVVQHVACEDTDEEDVKFIGVYSASERAQDAVARLSGLPGFRDYSRGFHIDEYFLDQDYWQEGFGPG